MCVIVDTHIPIPVVMCDLSLWLLVATSYLGSSTVRKLCVLRGLQRRLEFMDSNSKSHRGQNNDKTDVQVKLRRKKGKQITLQFFIETKAICEK